MNKRQHGLGSVNEYRPGYWQIKYTTSSSDRRSKAGYKSKKEAEAALAAAITDVERGDYFDERKGRTLFGIIAQEHVKRAELRQSTRRNYETLLRTSLAPLMSVPIGEISILRVDRWWHSQRRRPVNRRNSYFLMRGIMKSAIRWEYIRTSPCLIYGAGKDVAKPRPTWAVGDYERVLEHLPEIYKTPIVVMFTGHLRVGELVGLNASDYKPATGRISVTKQGHGVETKTGQHKQIKLLGPGIHAMTDHLNQLARIGATPLFTGPKGGRLSQQALRRAWLGACAEVGLEDFRLHDLRHIGLTEVARAVKNPKDIQERAGHASATSTMRYLHSDLDRDSEVADLVTARLLRKLT